MPRPSLDSVRIAVRTLAKQPGFTAVVVLSLALAIAINTTMYSVLDALINPRVDIRRPDDIYYVRLYGDIHSRVSTAQKDSALRVGLHNVEAVAWVDEISSYFNRTVESEQQMVEGSVKPVGVEYFDLIGPHMIAGRAFSRTDETSTPPAVILNETFAAKLFPAGSDPIGATVKIDTIGYTVVGVLSRYSDFPDWRGDAFVLGKPRAREAFVRVIRLRAGSSAQAADRELQVLAQRIALAAGEDPDPRNVAFRFGQPGRRQFQALRFHYAIGLSVIAVLLVACGNIANMQLARGITRRRELALRTALGATRGRIVRHLVVESVLLAGGGLILGLVLTFWSAAILKAAIPPSVGSLIVEPHLNWRVLAFALVATVACVFIVGVLPAIRVSRVDPSEMLKSGAGTGATRKHRQQYGYLVAVEIALALGLLSGASVLVRAAMRTSVTTLRFDPMPLVTGFMVGGRPPATEEKRPTSQILGAIEARLTSASGVAAAGASTSGAAINNAVTVSDSGRGVREIPAPRFGYQIVSPGYLRAMGLPVIRGRDFRDGERDEAVAIIDEFTAASLWPGSSPIGALIKLGDAKSSEPFVRIVGVAGFQTPRRGDALFTSGMRLGDVYYLPGPRDSTLVGPRNPGSAHFIARASGDASKLPLLLRRVGARNARPMGERVRAERQNRAFVAEMFTLFAALGLGLAAFGVFGVVAHSVAERRRELGVRIALGATARDILNAVLRESVLIGLAGIALGLLGTKYGVRLLMQFALEDDLYNAPLFAGAALFLFGVAALSAFVPALCATKVDPTESLRCE